MIFGKKTGIPHEWVPSQLGHGDLMCKNCMITSAEAKVLNLVNDCQRSDDTVDAMRYTMTNTAKEG